MERAYRKRQTRSADFKDGLYSWKAFADVISQASLRISKTWHKQYKSVLGQNQNTHKKNIFFLLFIAPSFVPFNQNHKNSNIFQTRQTLLTFNTKKNYWESQFEIKQILLYRYIENQQNVRAENLPPEYLPFQFRLYFVFWNVMDKNSSERQWPLIIKCTFSLFKPFKAYILKENKLQNRHQFVSLTIWFGFFLLLFARRFGRKGVGATEILYSKQFRVKFVNLLL